MGAGSSGTRQLPFTLLPLHLSWFTRLTSRDAAGGTILKPGDGEATRLTILGNGKGAILVRDSRLGNLHPPKNNEGERAVLLLAGVPDALEGQGPS